MSGCRASFSSGTWLTSNSARAASAAPAIISPVPRQAARRISAAAWPHSAPWPAGRPSRMPSAASSAAAHDSGRPADCATAAVTRYGCGSVQAWPAGMAANSTARDRPSPGCRIWPIARSSMTRLAASGQSPAAAACRTASASRPVRAYHRAARRCKAATRSGPSRAESFRFSREWLRTETLRASALRSSSVLRRLNLPPSYVLIHRVLASGLGVLCQLECEAPFRAEVLRWMPGYADTAKTAPQPQPTCARSVPPAGSAPPATANGHPRSAPPARPERGKGRHSRRSLRGQLAQNR